MKPGATKSRRSSWRGGRRRPGVRPGRRPGRRRLDYTPGSIHALDAALEAAHVGALALTPMQTVGAAAYLYEVRREHGGLYEVCDDEDPVVLVCGESGAQVAWPPSPGRAAHPLRAGRGHPALLRTFHRGPACRRAPDPALDPRFPAVAAACRDAAGAPGGHMRNTRRPLRAPGADCLGTERKAPYNSAIPHPGFTRRLSPGGLFTAVHSRPLYASVCLAPGAPA